MTKDQFILVLLKLFKACVRSTRYECDAVFYIHYNYLSFVLINLFPTIMLPFVQVPDPSPNEKNIKKKQYLLQFI